MPTDPLPARPSLTYYRKRAKALLHQLRFGDPDAAQRFHRWHPRFSAASRANVVVPSCVLADAQLVIAREHGAATWAEFKQRVARAAPSNQGLPASAESVSVPAGRRRFTDAQVRALAERELGGSPPIPTVIGLIDSDGRRVLTINTGDDAAPDGRTVFGGALITRPFVALIAADLARRGLLAWSDPVADHLPPGTVVPSGGDRPITLLDLATDRAGLPPLPPGYTLAGVATGARPLDEFTRDDLYRLLETSVLPCPVNTRTAYSFVGHALLIDALVHRTGQDLNRLLAEIVCEPLGMSRTHVAGSGPLTRTVGLTSCVEDLLRFLAAMLGDAPPRLAETIAQLQHARDASRRERPLGWSAFSVDSAFASEQRVIYWVDGFGGGILSFMGGVQHDRIGIVTAAFVRGNDTWVSRALASQTIGLHLLDERWPPSTWRHSRPS